MQENGKKVWLHDGAGGLLLIAREISPKEIATSTYGTNNFPVPVPPQVTERLEEPLKSIAQQAGRLQ